MYIFKVITKYRASKKRVKQYYIDNDIDTKRNPKTRKWVHNFLRTNWEKLTICTNGVHLVTIYKYR